MVGRPFEGSCRVRITDLGSGADRDDGTCTYRIELLGQLCFGLDTINFAQKLEARFEITYIRPQFRGEISENTGDFPPFLVLQIGNLIIQLQNFGRFDIRSLTARGLVMNEPLHASLVLGNHRYYQPAIPDAGFSIGLRVIQIDPAP